MGAPFLCYTGLSHVGSRSLSRPSSGVMAIEVASRMSRNGAGKHAPEGRSRRGRNNSLPQSCRSIARSALAGLVGSTAGC